MSAGFMDLPKDVIRHIFALDIADRVIRVTARYCWQGGSATHEFRMPTDMCVYWPHPTWPAGSLAETWQIVLVNKLLAAARTNHIKYDFVVLRMHGSPGAIVLRFPAELTMHCGILFAFGLEFYDGVFSSMTEQLKEASDSVDWSDRLIAISNYQRWVYELLRERPHIKAQPDG